ncbi:MAG: radical SAM family heme chaperone HemW [Proteobacteria bacterium]|nr:radical SAM family heme chaperone HemW [Pseudomonadota bacterium]
MADKTNRPHPFGSGFGLYIHYPFCQSKCPYCDFNVHIDPDRHESQFADSLIAEMGGLAKHTNTQSRTLRSIFFGGGTPSLMPPESAQRIITAAKNIFGLDPDCEITLEVNPTHAEAAKLQDFCSIGINRLSLGVQSLKPQTLAVLGRQHTPKECLHAIQCAQKACANVSADFICATPNQTADAWREELAEILALNLAHLSLYQLTIETGTAFYRQVQNGTLTPCNDEIASDIFTISQNMCSTAGLEGYEISNYGRTTSVCRHNLLYWQSGDWLGIGPGAVGKFWHNSQHQNKQQNKRIEYRTPRNPKTWQETVAQNNFNAYDWHEASPAVYGKEALMMGLRLATGVPLGRIAERAGDKAKWLDEEAVMRLIDQGLMAEKKGWLAITQKGRVVSNAILREILPEILPSLEK